MSPKNKPSKPLDIYVRVSRVNEREGDSFLSPDDQEKKCRAIATAHGYAVGKVLVDLDESGGKASRPAFDEAFERISSGASGGIIVAKLDRFGRRVRNVLTGVEDIEAMGGAFVCVDPTIDTSTPTGRFVLTVFAALAEMELDRLTEGWKSAQATAVARGVVIGPAPTGYRKSGDNGTLVRVPGDCEKIAAAYARRVAGGSWTDVASELDGVTRTLYVKGKKPEPYIAPFTHGAARKLLMSPLYKGIVTVAITKEGPKDATGKPTRIKVGAHEKFVLDYLVVPESVWDEANRRADSPAGRTDAGGFLLGKMLKCSCCGRTLTGARDVKDDGRTYVYYRCANSGATCSQKARVDAAEVEALVIDGAFAWLAQADLQVTTGEDVDPETRGRFEQAITDAKMARRAVAVAGLDPDDPMDALELERVAFEVEQAERMLAEYIDSLGVKPVSIEQMQAIFGELEWSPEATDADRARVVQGQREFLRNIVSYVVVSGKGSDGPAADRCEFHFEDGTVERLSLPEGEG